MSKVKIPSKAKIRVIWRDKLSNYTVERERRIGSYISKKYNNDNVDVAFEAQNENNEDVTVDVADNENVTDTTYQRKLMSKWLETNNVDIPTERLISLDDKVNQKLSETFDLDKKHKDYTLDNLEWSNFLSYGDGNALSLSEMEGVTVVDSTPSNQGGKTTFTIDLPLFLFFGTTTKGKTAIKMFNKFRDSDTVSAKGVLTIDSNKYIIERTITRKLKRNKKDYTVKTSLNFEKLLPDGTIQNLEGEQRRETEEYIKSSIGNVNDFLLTVLADSNNLLDIIKAKATEKGRTLSRFIGLEVIEEKEKICKEMKSKWVKNLKMNQYNIVELETKNEELDKEILETEVKLKTFRDEVLEIRENITDSTQMKEDLLQQKNKIDNDVINLIPEEIDRQINQITKQGKLSKEKYVKSKEELESLEELNYDEDEHQELIKTDRKLNSDRAEKQSEVKVLTRLIKNLEDGEFCGSCGQPLVGVDNKDEIKLNKAKIESISDEVNSINEELTSVKVEISKLDEIKKQTDNHYRHSIMVDKLELELDNLRLKLKEQKDLKKTYESNLDNIEKNKQIDGKILGYTTKISNLNNKLFKINDEINSLETSIKINNNDISKNIEVIEVIKTEEKTLIIFDMYIKLFGKNGISKLIMKNLVPLINSELNRLLGDITNFKLKLDINDKNEVEFLLDNGDVNYPIEEGSGFEKTISSMALRVVMSKISRLPKPNFRVFDECFGAISPENLDLVGDFFNKCSSLFPNIFIISHNPVIKDWSNKLITVNKKNDISSLMVK